MKEIKNKEEKPKKVGRPSLYSQKLAIEICGEISTNAVGLKKLCTQHENWPSYKVIREWLIIHEEFRDLYARAKEYQAEILAEEMIDISDYSAEDYIVGDNGKSVLDHEHVQRSKLRIDTRKWVASKLLPKKYGDKIQNEITGLDGSAIKTETRLTIEEMVHRTNFMFSKMEKDKPK